MIMKNVASCNNLALEKNGNVWLFLSVAQYFLYIQHRPEAKNILVVDVLAQKVA